MGSCVCRRRKKSGGYVNWIFDAGSWYAYCLAWTQEDGHDSTVSERCSMARNWLSSHRYSARHFWWTHYVGWRAEKASASLVFETNLNFFVQDRKFELWRSCSDNTSERCSGWCKTTNHILPKNGVESSRDHWEYEWIPLSILFCTFKSSKINLN